MQTEYPAKYRIYGSNPSTGEDEAIWKDPYTGAIVEIDIAHEAIHLGKYFSHSGIISGLANNASYDHLFVTPSVGGAHIHLRIFLINASSAPVSLYFYENTTTSNNGTAQVGYNFNRNSANATIGLYHTPTITGVGTLINTVYIAAPTAGINSGVGQTSGTEWVLKQGAKYLSRITNNSGSSSNIGYIVEWYEL